MSDKNQITIVFKNKKDLILTLITVGIVFSSLISIITDMFSFIEISKQMKVTFMGVALIGIGVYGIACKKIFFYNRPSSKLFNIFINGLFILFGIVYVLIIRI